METECCLTGGDGVCENKTATLRPAHPVRWWPLLLGPLTMVWVYVASATTMHDFVSRRVNENAALFLLSVPLIAFGVQAASFRSEFPLFMAALCAAFFCREWHFAGTSTKVPGLHLP